MNETTVEASASPRSIDHVLDTLEVGGAERLVVLLAQHQQSRGTRVRVHAMFGLGALAEALRSGGIEVIDHGAKPEGLYGLPSLVKALRAEAPEILHCHNITATLIGAMAASVTRTRACIATRHGWPRRDGRRKPELKFAVASIGCSAVVAVCEAARRGLVAQTFSSPSKIVAIVNGALAPKVTRTIVPPPDRFVVVTVARLSWAKDHATLLRGLALALTRRPEIELHLVGDGPERPRLEQLAIELGLRNAVRFFGERSDVGECLAGGHAFALSSVSEGLPVALLEALAVGLLPIVSDVGGMPEVVATAGIGRVFPAGNVQQLADALVSSASEIGQRRLWSEKARDAFQRHYTIARMCSEYDLLMQKCIARTSPGRYL